MADFFHHPEGTGSTISTGGPVSGRDPNLQSFTESANAPAELQEAIRRRANEIFVRNGRIEGKDIENWMQAEAEIRSEFAARAQPRRSLIVKVDGVRYVGEYDPTRADGYFPGEFAA